MKRPRSVTIIGWLILFQGLFFLLRASSLLLTLGAINLAELAPELNAALPEYGLRGVSQGIADAAIGVFGFVSGVGLLRQRPWASLMAMIIQGSHLSIGLFGYLRGMPPYFEMLFAMVLVFLLNQRDLQRALSAAQHRDDPRSIRTVEDDLAAAAEVQSEVAQRQ